MVLTSRKTNNRMNSTIVACASCGRKNRIIADKKHLGPRCGHCGAPLVVSASAYPVELADANFNSFIGSGTLPVMVDFYSPACGPCRQLAPVVTRLAGVFAGRLLVAKIDTGRNPVTASRYQIRGVPTLLFFRNGRVVEQAVGALPEAELLNLIRRVIG